VALAVVAVVAVVVVVVAVVAVGWPPTATHSTAKVVSRETAQSLADPIALAKAHNQTKASPLWVQASVLRMLRHT
jgi:hypothetical protein